MKVYWMRSPEPGNLGDVLTPVLLDAYGFDVEWARPDHAELLMCGSLLGKARPGVGVFGTGAMSMDTRPHPQAVYHAVRGPISRTLVTLYGGEAPEVLGDPALLLPRVWDKPVEVRHEHGVVLHYADTTNRVPEGAHRINPIARDPLTVVDEIRACERISSSSLHGLVVAEAYGIPWTHLPCPDLHGDGTKFKDFRQSLPVDTDALEAALEALR